MTDFSNSIQWSTGYQITNINRSDIEPSGVYGVTKSNGRKNTDDLVALLGINAPAAYFCANLTTGGATVGDWYLPSYGELEKIAISGISGFHVTLSHSSSECLASDRGWGQTYFDMGCLLGDFQGVVYGDKNGLYTVRAIRAF